MTPEARLHRQQFPRASAYHPDWLLAGVSGAANPLWMTEWLTEALELKPGMRVLDLGCGRALSSVFLHREFGVQVWAADLWFSASENQQRIRDAGASDGVFPIHADARSLPFASGFFDAVMSIDSFLYYGTDELYLNYLSWFLKPDGVLGIAGAGLTQEFQGRVPAALRDWWTPDLCVLHSASWWQRHWEKTGLVEVESAQTMPEGWRLWLDWLDMINPSNVTEIEALKADAGNYLGYIRVVARRRPGVQVSEPILSVPTEYRKTQLLRHSVE